jgi:hypothetical protein
MKEKIVEILLILFHLYLFSTSRSFHFLLIYLHRLNCELSNENIRDQFKC